MLPPPGHGLGSAFTRDSRRAGGTGKNELIDTQRLTDRVILAAMAATKLEDW